MEDFKIVVFLMAILVSLTAIANKRKLPFPILLVFAGLFIGFVPQLPDLALDPDVVFIVLLPPLLYDAATKTSWHEFRSSIGTISLLAITLVFFTTVAVAITAHFLIPGFSWPIAFVLGAIVSPPDAVAATGIIRGLGLNKKVITILEGESLVNDASALVAYRYAVIAVSTGSFIFWKAGLQFLLIAGAGIIIGFVIGYLFVLAHKNITQNPVVETSLTLLAPYVSYLAAEELHVSGILSVVTTGLVISWRSPEVFSYQTRMRTRSVWDTLIFLLHGFVFIMIGLQLPAIIKSLSSSSFLQILTYGLIISFVTIAVRIFWVFAGAYWQKINSRKKKSTNSTSTNEEDENLWKNVLIVAWTGTRGVISLATALALPLVLADGTAFPHRNAIIFLAFVVIFVTLVIQGLSLPLLIRWLKIKPQDNLDAEEKELQLYLASTTLNFIEQDLTIKLEKNQMDELRKKYESLVVNLTKEIKRQKKAIRENIVPGAAKPDNLLKARLEISKFQRNLLLKLHKEGEFSDPAIKKIERELDVDELKLNLQVPKEPA